MSDIKRITPGSKADLARRMADRRRELIARPLAEIWEDLAAVAMDGGDGAPAAREPVIGLPAEARKIADEIMMNFRVGADHHFSNAEAMMIERICHEVASRSAAISEASTETQQTISQWTRETFGEASSNARVAARANEEMAELLRALTSDEQHPKAVEEAADVVIILYRLADRMGADLHAEIDRKMQINRKREWKVTDGHGYHVRAGSAASARNDPVTSQPDTDGGVNG